MLARNPFWACRKRYQSCACDCACDDFDGPDFSGCEYGRLLLPRLLLLVYSWLYFWLFCIVRQSDKFIPEAWQVCFPFVVIYFWEKPLTAWMLFIHVGKDHVLLFWVSIFRKIRYLCEWYLSIRKGSHVVAVCLNKSRLRICRRIFRLLCVHLFEIKMYVNLCYGFVCV
jgi:hypothetical protein